MIESFLFLFLIYKNSVVSLQEFNGWTAQDILETPSSSIINKLTEDSAQEGQAWSMWRKINSS
ncbi:hypothetical protein RchiOBHm_Chr5g0028321 [Rosa chinensis]|uniref:Uncharacterized protein n=1 Tax=Rosa chinensis TaxID=74649 RepID=A0A2P6Q9D2_ROSCH|nr:hypothetical protein RchiOBHm_Chr5g0028321 [Rosa chinensis]